MSASSAASASRIISDRVLNSSKNASMTSAVLYSTFHRSGNDKVLSYRIVVLAGLLAAVSTQAAGQGAPIPAPAAKSPAAAAQKPAPPVAQTPEPSPPAADSLGADPQVTTATFGDWTLRCQFTGQDAGRQKTCEVAQTLQAEGQQGVLAQIAVGRLSTREPLKVTVLFGVNILIPGQLRMAVDDKDGQPVELAWRRCIPAGCLGDGELREEVLKRWRAQSGRGVIHLKDGSGRDVNLPFSFRGLARALDGFAKS
jgi:invasion protein IalB